MRRSGAFWGLLLIILGGLFLLNTLGILSFSVWRLLWPVFLVALGISILLGLAGGRREYSGEPEFSSIPLEGASSARVKVPHGAGRLTMRGGAASGDLLSGTFGTGLDARTRREGDTRRVNLEPDAREWWRWVSPWTWGRGGPNDWSIDLNTDVPLSLKIESGASETRLDLTDVRLTELDLQTGASSTEVTLPASAGHTRVKIQAGMAEVKVRVPDGVAARIKATGGLADINVDRDRFPRSGEFHQSPDYDTAEHKVEIDAETGMGSLRIR